MTSCNPGRALSTPVRAITTAVAIALLGACAGAARAPSNDTFAQAMPAAPASLRPLLELTEQEGPGNAVRNLTDLAVTAMRDEQYGIAERALDAAIQRIDSILPNDANADRAKSKFSAEDVKDFKGEPYERAMVYYYRGLLYARGGDYQNARAAFLAGGWQAATTPQERFGKTFGVMSLLGSWASRCDGDLERAKDLQAAAEREDASLAGVSLGQSLILLESGEAPRKRRAGSHGELLTFADGTRLDGAPTAVGDPAPGTVRGPWQPQLLKVGDLSLQATSRGGRPIQGILDGKAQFKDSSQKVGTAATEIGRQMILNNTTGNRDLNNAGLIGMVFGIGAMIASSATKPAADTRQIRLLPNELHLASAEAPMAGAVKVQLPNATPVTTRLLSAHARCQLHWGTTARVTLTAPELKPEARSRDSARHPAFRAELATIVNGGRS